MKRRYRRYFVILEEEDKGFSISRSEAVKGYGKIEVKNDNGILSLHCQNLKKLDEKKERYRLYLMHTKDTEEAVIVDAGPVQVDKYGKGEFVWEFNAENVKGFKKPIETFDVLVLLVEPLEESQRVIAPLVGYIHKEKTRWKPLLQKKLFVSTKREEIEQEKTTSREEPEALMPKKEEKPEEKELEKKQESAAPKEEKEPKKKQEESAPEKEKKVEEKQENTPLKEKKKPEKKKDIDTTKEEKPISAYSFEKDWDAADEKIHPAQQYIESTLKVFPTIKPFDVNLENYEWWQIPYSSQTFYRTYMPFISHVEMMINPYYHYYPYYEVSEYQKQLYRYQHYIFGICYENKKKAKYYVYGIPGRKTTTEQPYKGKTGFVYWHPSHYQQFKQEGFGYWLMHIEADTGKVVEPLKPTKVE